MATLEELQNQRAQTQGLMATTNDRNRARLQMQLDRIDNEIAGLQQPTPEAVPEGETAATQPMEAVVPAPIGTQNLINQTPPLNMQASTQPLSQMQMIPSSQPMPEFANGDRLMPQEQTPEVRSVSLADTKPGGFQGTTVTSQEPVNVAPQVALNQPFQTQTSTVAKQAVELPEEIKQDLTDVSQQDFNLRQRQLEAAETAEQIQGQREAIAGEMQSFADAAAEREQQFQKAINLAEEQWKAESDALAKEKIDSRRYWKNMSTGRTIASALAVALGGVAQAFVGGENLAAKMIIKAADDDVKDQIANLNNRKQFSKEAWTALQNKRTRFRSEEALKKDLMLTRLQGIEQKIEGYKAKAKSQDQINALEDTQQQLRRQIAKDKLDIFRLENPQQTTTTQALQLSPLALAQKVSKSTDTQRKEQEKALKEQRKLVVPGVGIALTDQDAKDLKKAKEAYDSTKQGIESLKQNIRGQFESLPGALGGTANKIETIAADIKAQYKQLMTLGTLDQGVENIFNQLLGDLTSTFMTEDTKLKKLQEFETAIENNFYNKAKARTVPGQNLTQQQQIQGSSLRSRTGG